MFDLGGGKVGDTDVVDFAGCKESFHGVPGLYPEIISVEASMNYFGDEHTLI